MKLSKHGYVSIKQNFKKLIYQLAPISFPTDLQAQLMVLMTQANGSSKIKAFSARFMQN